jgi:hypothetical protein
MRITAWGIIPLTLCVVTQVARAEDDDAVAGRGVDEVTDIKELSLSDLLDTKVDVYPRPIVILDDIDGRFRS